MQNPELLFQSAAKHRKRREKMRERTRRKERSNESAGSCEEWLKRGARVEAQRGRGGLSYVWSEAVVLEAKHSEGIVEVEFCACPGESERERETVRLWQQVRPLSHPEAREESYGDGARVEVFRDGGWWVGQVTTGPVTQKLRATNMVRVYFFSTGSEQYHHANYVRLSYDYTQEGWILADQEPFDDFVMQRLLENEKTRKAKLLAERRKTGCRDEAQEESPDLSLVRTGPRVRIRLSLKRPEPSTSLSGIRKPASATSTSSPNLASATSRGSVCQAIRKRANPSEADGDLTCHASKRRTKPYGSEFDDMQTEMNVNSWIPEETNSNRGCSFLSTTSEEKSKHLSEILSEFSSLRSEVLGLENVGNPLLMSSETEARMCHFAYQISMAAFHELGVQGRMPNRVAQKLRQDLKIDADTHNAICRRLALSLT